MENKILFTILLSLVLASCGGSRTFHDYARAGDTVAVPVGMQPTFNKDNITVTITPSTGAPVVYAATDPKIRGIINLYPDPVSSMIVSREIDEELTGGVLGYEINTRISANNDKDWYQTTVFVDIPVQLANGSNFPIGLAQITVSDDQSNSHTITLDIIAGTGTSNLFQAIIPPSQVPVNLSSSMIDSLSRVPHTTVFIDSTGSIPSAIELNFTHDPDETTVGGTGEAFVINPLGYKKALSWNDDGINLKVILIESRSGVIDDMNDYKIYITGSVTGLQLSSVTGYDNNGNTASGVLTATLLPN
jgi:hypothetical protein